MNRIYGWVVLLFMVVTLCVYGQTEIVPLTEDQIKDNETALILSMREHYALTSYSQVYNDIKSAMANKQVTLSWFFYVMLAESAYKSGKLSDILLFMPNTGHLRVFRQALTFLNNGDELKAARLLATLSTQSPALNYFTGKLYLGVGKEYEGAGYARLGARMQEVPYGLYYAGLGQNAVGNYSKAYDFLEEAKDLLIPAEEDLRVSITLQMSVASFGNKNFQRAYDLAMSVYDKDPVYTLNVIDPGIILVAMEKSQEAKSFWQDALKKRLPSNLVSQIKRKLSLSQRLVDPTYPQKWVNL